MRADRMKVQLWAFILLSGGVAANIFVVQSPAFERFVREAASQQNVRTADAREFAGATGSISAAAVVPAEEASAAPAQHHSNAAEPGGQNEPAVTRAVQRELQVRGYDPGAVDGIPGVVTQAAIIGFEHDHGLPLTGKPSQALLKSILLGSQTASLKGYKAQAQTDEAESLIRSVQTSLAARGYKPGPVNGRLTPATIGAIREFEVDQSLPETGRISGPLVVRLASTSARVASQRP